MGKEAYVTQLCAVWTKWKKENKVTNVDISKKTGLPINTIIRKFRHGTASVYDMYYILGLYGFEIKIKKK